MSRFDCTLADFAPGQRVQLHPSTDLWARGARYGTVLAVGMKWVHVTLDAKRGRAIMAPFNLIPVESVTTAVDRCEECGAPSSTIHSAYGCDRSLIK